MPVPDPPPATGPGRPRATTHRALRDAAMREFATHGYAATSVQRIAEVAGIGRNTFFRYFPSKVALLGDDYAANQEVVARHLRDAPAGGDALDQVVDAVRASIRYDDADREFYRLRLTVLADDPTVPAEWARPLVSGWAELVAAHVLASAADRGPHSRAVAEAVGYGVRGVLSSVMASWADGELDLQEALDLLGATVREMFGASVRGLVDG
ncbi:TetR family transcriptional regulator [Cellulomonas wangsupingiae]|uniref:TetR family transcriptional regulator n=1 Tax=Cellulomonas wangsupingiae TaxID=2968085 RepID=A0ABY5K676_9CELL|nr:TetR family transcriptional regulator [Cellulomonas wangsupingiae]MCC2334265.1 TetR family transcriptional regulator [Cellulomonas wangsupingiae]MCM0641265.1 TetR family transcriptional regulator [Cellulomonas wangsupingiae]UUI65942.1 TetR family transcriptional regulator [Cellulomonas wangsupingiae]